MSPEVIMNKKYDNKVDVYSFGIVMHELFFEKQPFKDQRYVNMWSLGIDISTNELRPTVPKDMSAYTQNEMTYISMMKKCWMTDAKDRPTFDQVIELLSEFSFE